MLRILLADDDPVFLSRMEHLLMQYAAQRQLNIQIGSYTRDDISSFILQSYDLAFWILILAIVEEPVSIWPGGFGRRGMTQSSSLSQAMLNMRLKDMNCVRSDIF